MTAPRTLQHPQNHFADTTVDKLIRDTCRELAALGVNIGVSRVARLVRRYAARVADTGYPFADWMTAQLALHAERQARIRAALARVLPYADPTGETAVDNIMAGR